MEKIPVLFSYAYVKPGMMALLTKPEVHKNFDIVVDSGAFTAFKSGKVITLDEYIKFIRELPFPVERYFTLDSIGNVETTLKNYDILCKEGLEPIPIFTRGDTKRNFDYYYASRGLVGIGGIAGTNGCKDYLIDLYETGIITGKKVHWLGFHIHDFLLHYKPFSCDTSSWASGSRFARGWYYYNRKYRIFTKDDYKSIELKMFCEKYGLDSYRLSKEEAWRRRDGNQSFVQVIQLYAALDYIKNMRERIGTKIYMSISDFTIESNIEMMLEHIDNFRKGSAK